MFAYEIYIAFRRIGKPQDKGGTYLHATWESTHTFLVLSVNYFVWLYSSAVVAVGHAVFLPLTLFGAAFIFRATLYVKLFYIKTSHTRVNRLLDHLFAWTHIVMLGCLLSILINTLRVLSEGNYQPNNLLPSLLWPGLVLMVPLISVPLYFLYRTNGK